MFIVQYNYTKGEFVGKETYEINIVSIGKRAMKMHHNWVVNVGAKLSTILPAGDKYLKITGDLTYGELKDKLRAAFMKGSSFTEYEMALYKIDEEIRESQILRNKLIIDKPTYTPLEWYEDYDCRLIYKGKTYQAKAVQDYKCGANPGIYIIWVIPEEPSELDKRVERIERKGILGKTIKRGKV